MKTIKCQMCVNEGKKSCVYDLGGTRTCLAGVPYYDEDGKFHSHDPNKTTTSYKCSNGHEWKETSKEKCWCGWPNKEENKECDNVENAEPQIDKVSDGLITDRNDPRLQTIKANGQQEGYLVLSDEERAKGFVRLVRKSYKHVGIVGPKYQLRDLTEDEHKQYDQFKYAQYEEYPESDGAVVGRYWTQEQLNNIGNGCRVVTTIGYAIAESYATNPKFYGATFCCGCGKHLPVGEEGEFVWMNEDGTVSTERVGT